MIILAYQCCFRELIQAQKQHKEKLKVFLKGDIPLEDTEIGRTDRKLRMVMSRRHLMKKKKKKPGVRDLLKVLTKASAHIDDGSDKETTTTNDESEDDEVKPPTAIPTRINSMANLMNFLPSIKRNMSLTAQTEDSDSVKTE